MVKSEPVVAARAWAVSSAVAVGADSVVKEVVVRLASLQPSVHELGVGWAAESV